MSETTELGPNPFRYDRTHTGPLAPSRETRVQAVANLLLSQREQVLTLLGGPGMGKTSFLLRLADVARELGVHDRQLLVGIVDCKKCESFAYHSPVAWLGKEIKTVLTGLLDQAFGRVSEKCSAPMAALLSALPELLSVKNALAQVTLAAEGAAASKRALLRIGEVQRRIQTAESSPDSQQILPDVCRLLQDAVSSLEVVDYFIANRQRALQDRVRKAIGVLKYYLDTLEQFRCVNSSLREARSSLASLSINNDARHLHGLGATCKNLPASITPVVALDGFDRFLSRLAGDSTLLCQVLDAWQDIRVESNYTIRFVQSIQRTPLAFVRANFADAREPLRSALDAWAASALVENLVPLPFDDVVAYVRDSGPPAMQDHGPDIAHWAGGCPFLVKRVCHAVFEHLRKQADEQKTLTFPSKSEIWREIAKDSEVIRFAHAVYADLSAPERTLVRALYHDAESQDAAAQGDLPRTVRPRWSPEAIPVVSLLEGTGCSFGFGMVLARQDGSDPTYRVTSDFLLHLLYEEHVRFAGRGRWHKLLPRLGLAEALYLSFVLTLVGAIILREVGQDALPATLITPVLLIYWLIRRQVR